MLRSLIAFSLNYRLVVLMLAVGLLICGALAAIHAPWDVFPEFAPPQINIQTEAPGLSTDKLSSWSPCRSNRPSMALPVS